MSGSEHPDPRAGGGKADSDNGGRPEMQLTDPDDYHEMQRLREIHDARRDVRRVMSSMTRYTGDSDHAIQRGNLADAVTMYITELEPLMEAVDYDDSLDRTVWDNLRHYATLMGRKPDEHETAGYEQSIYVYRQANRFLAEVKPILTEDEPSEWEV